MIEVRPLSIQVKIEVLAAGLPLHHRALMTVDTTLRSVLTAHDNRKWVLEDSRRPVATATASWVEPVSSSVSRAECTRRQISHCTTEEKQTRANGFPSWRCTCGDKSPKNKSAVPSVCPKTCWVGDQNRQFRIRRTIGAPAGTSKRSMTRGSQEINRIHVVNKAHI